MNPTEKTNLLVIGSGLAGVIAAISVADEGKQAVNITKTTKLKSVISVLYN